MAVLGSPRGPAKPTFEAPDEADAGGRLREDRPIMPADAGFTSFGLGEVMAGFTDRTLDVDPCDESEEGVRRNDPYPEAGMTAEAAEEGRGSVPGLGRVPGRGKVLALEVKFGVQKRKILALFKRLCVTKPNL